MALLQVEDEEADAGVIEDTAKVEILRTMTTRKKMRMVVSNCYGYNNIDPPLLSSMEDT